MRIIYADGVFEELVNLSFYLANDNEEIAQKFLDSCDETFADLVKSPLIGSIHNFKNPTLGEVRMWRVKGFEKYLIFYQTRASTIKILHVLHSATDYNRAFE
jgi:toxin ParE1/3/4